MPSHHKPVLLMQDKQICAGSKPLEVSISLSRMLTGGCGGVEGQGGEWGGEGGEWGGGGRVRGGGGRGLGWADLGRQKTVCDAFPTVACIQDQQCSKCMRVAEVRKGDITYPVLPPYP